MDSNNFNNGQQPNPYFNNSTPNNNYPGSGTPNNGYPGNSAPNNGYSSNGYQNNGMPGNGYPNNGNSYGYGYQQPQKAPNIFKQFAFSFVPPKYDQLATVKTGSMIGFVCLLTLIATIISFISFSIGFSVFTNSEVMEKWLPDFEIKNGKLSIDREYVLDEDYVYIYVTQEVEEFTYADVEYLEDRGYTDILLAGRKNLILQQDGETQKVAYKEFGSNFVLNKQWIIEELMPIIWVCVAIGFVFYYVFRTLWYFFCAAIYLLIAMIIGAIMNKKISAGALFRTAVYSKVFMFVIVSLLNWIPLVSNFIPGVLRIVVTIVFMGFAVAKLPNNR